MQGTVPYLGTFLTDLTMIDTGMPDRTSEGLINFEKKRKEFEVIAQIKLLQSAANLYAIKYEPVFFDWFYSLRVYDDTESYELSCEIEQVPVAPVTPGEGRGHKKKPR
jgi:ral guanine nucleotide dissociation stimulator-like 1